MKLQQLRYLCEVARRGLSVSDAAEALHTSQPGVSKQIRLLEDELGVEVFVRSGKRMTGVTEPGRAVLEVAERILREAENLKRAGQEYRDQAAGSLAVATTHTQARYALPPVVKQFMARYPRVRLSLYQGSPTQIAQQVVDGSADLAIATESVEQFPELVTLPCYQWNRCVVVPPGHPLLDQPILTLEALAAQPIVTYDFAFTGRSEINRAFRQRGLEPNVVLTAIDADVIKTYVELGLGVGIMAQMAFDPARDTGLRAIDASHLFASSTTRIGMLKGSWLRGYAFDFITMFAPQLTRKAVENALRGEAAPEGDYAL